MSTASPRKPVAPKRRKAAARKGQNPRGQGDLLREQLLDAAGEMLLEHGDEGRLTIRGVTRRAGVSPMAFYLHFPDRDALVLAVLERGFTEFRAGILAAEAEAPDPATALRDAGRAYMRFALQRPGHYRLIFSLALPERRQGVPAAAAAFEDLVRLVGACMDAGLAPRAYPSSMATSVWTALHGIVTLRHTSPGFPWPPVDEMLERVCVGMVGLAPG